MFIPTAMRKINIFIQEEDIGQIAVALARLETLDLRETEPQEEWSGAQEESWRELANTYTNQTRRAEKLLQTLQINRRDAPPPERVRPRRDAGQLAEQLQKIEQAVQAWQERYEEATRRREQLHHLEREIRLLEPLNLSIEELRALEYLHLQAATIPKERLADLETSLFYENTAGLHIGEPLYGTRQPLSVALGPGLLGATFDGIQRPLDLLRERSGIFIQRGENVPALDEERPWSFTPRAEAGQEVGPGDLLGVVPETALKETLDRPRLLRLKEDIPNDDLEQIEQIENEIRQKLQELQSEAMNSRER